MAQHQGDEVFAEEYIEKIFQNLYFKKQMAEKYRKYSGKTFGQKKKLELV